MNSSAAEPYIPVSRLDQLREARTIIREESDALQRLADRLDAEFCDAVELLTQRTGKVVVTGMGKAGHVARKISATMSSTGTPSSFLHPAEAFHGDLGCLSANDVVIAMSNSGETEEVCRLLPSLRKLQVSLIAVTASESSTLGTSADVVLTLGTIRETGAHSLAPSSSSTAMLALGDALALVAGRVSGFSPQQFALFHPGGSLGRRFMRVEEVMRSGTDVRIADYSLTIRQILVELQTPSRRTGAIMLVDQQGQLKGLFTDSDLARLLESRQEEHLDRPACEVMTASPTTIYVGATLPEAVEILSRKKVSELPVIDRDQKPVGMIDITDVISLMPNEFENSNSTRATDSSKTA